ncbi:hypothetical protein [uncultured Selenomonas sp.]|nr:hypothetical protein [uncultured Selenomonas sp.]
MSGEQRLSAEHLTFGYRRDVRRADVRHRRGRGEACAAIEGWVGKGK